MGKSTAVQPVTGNAALRGGFAAETLAAAKTLATTDAQFQALDPGGAGRDVTLPDVEGDLSFDGYWVVIANTADAAEDLTVKDASTATIGTVSQNELGVFYVSAAGAWALFRIVTTAT